MTETRSDPARKSKCRDIVESLRADILSGRYVQGARLPSEAELLRKFGVSRMTVVKAVQQLQQEGLVNRRAGSGTFAAGIRGEQKNSVFGLLIPDLGQTEIFEPICRGMMSSPIAKSHSLSWGHTQSDNKQSEEEAESLCHRYIEQGVSGIFFAPLEFPVHRDVNSRILQALDKAKIPTILLDRDYVDYPQRGRYDVVGLNNRAAGYVVTEHLLKQGGSRIAFFARASSAETVEHRIVGYREALHAHRKPIAQELILRGDPSDRDYIAAVLRDNRIDSIMCANDQTAAMLMQTLLSMHVRIPQDIRIAGVDDVKYASLLPIPLTTLHQPCTDIGITAMSAMLERLRNPALPARSIMLNGHLVIRNSCGSASQ